MMFEYPLLSLVPTSPQKVSPIVKGIMNGIKACIMYDDYEFR